LSLRQLAATVVAHAVASALGEGAVTDEMLQAAQAAGGSVGRALMFLEGDALELHRQVTGLLDRLPMLDARALHALGDKIAGTRVEPLVAFMDAVNTWLSTRLQTAPQETQRLARVGDIWTTVNRAMQDAEAYNLDRKPLVFSVFGQLAEAARI
jgi:DNA polymerase-3 subunit delta'